MRHDVITVPLQLKTRERTFNLFNTGLSRTVCREVLDGFAYPILPDDVLLSESVTTIYDVGANVGASCIYWIDSYPHAKVYAYEPCLDTYCLLCNNTEHDQVEPYNIALGIEEGFVDLFHNVEDDACNSLKNHKAGSHEKVVVERARRHINGPIDILKVDTEGCEVEILSDVEAWLCEIKVLYLEYHSEKARGQIDALLKPTHTLWSSTATRPHRGNVCYVRTKDIPQQYADWAI